MTKKEMSEIFGVMLQAWPNAEMFRGGVEKLAPTIDLWTTALRDVEVWVLRRAVIETIKVSRFPPTIAELREQATAIRIGALNRIDTAWQKLKAAMLLEGMTPEEAVAEVGLSETELAAIAAMGGPDALIVKTKDAEGRQFERWAFPEFEAACKAQLQQEALSSGGLKRIGGKR